MRTTYVTLALSLVVFPLNAQCESNRYPPTKNIKPLGSPTQQRKVPPANITISEMGLGPINGDSPFNRDSIQKLLPTFVVEDGRGATEGEEFPTIRVSDKYGTVAVINPQADHKRISSVVVEAPRVRNELGPRLGWIYSQIYRADVTGKCSPGMEEMSGTVLCLDPTSEHVYYLLLGQWDGPNGAIPPTNILGRWAVNAIIWKP
jgi:hypothetical protein